MGMVRYWNLNQRNSGCLTSGSVQYQVGHLVEAVSAHSKGVGTR